MPPSIPSPNLTIPLAPLTEEAFSPFGTVIQNPAHTKLSTDSSDVSSTSRLMEKVVIEANQGSALKYPDVSHLSNFYARAASKTPARAIMTMFVCKPRDLRRVEKAEETGLVTAKVDGRPSVERYFDIGILERHPYTPQTFIPMGLDKNDTQTRFLVIVAPTLPTSPIAPVSTIESSQSDPSQPAPSPSTEIAGLVLHPDAPRPQGSGLPDLQNIKAFVADGSQAVTYGPGTWHAPMVVLGERAVDFVVVQFANGVGEEDCQEVVLETSIRGGRGEEEGDAGADGAGICVLVDILPKPIKSGLWVKAKL